MRLQSATSQLRGLPYLVLKDLGYHQTSENSPNFEALNDEKKAHISALFKGTDAFPLFRLFCSSYKCNYTLFKIACQPLAIEIN